MDCEATQLSILITEDEEIRELNRGYRGKDLATDVLAFAAREAKFPNSGIETLGDVVISLATACRQAKEAGISPREEVVRLIIHGTLHLLGYDHENVTPTEARRMQSKEDELFELLQGFLRGP